MLPKTTLLLLTLVSGLFASPCLAQPAGETATAPPVYEMRVYYAAPGKLEALLDRFRNHTCQLFEKHGMHNVAYFVPTAEDNNKLVYFLSYPSSAAREASWKAFQNDPDWQAAKKRSEQEGRLVDKVESRHLTLTDYSPPFRQVGSTQPRIFELRTYTASKNNLPALHDRFRDHTLQLFDKHGMKNVAYFELLPDQAGADNTLIYLIAHPNAEARQQAFQNFGKDPAWQAARKQSEEKAGGPLTAPKGVQFELLTPTDFSPIQ